MIKKRKRLHKTLWLSVILLVLVLFGVYAFSFYETTHLNGRLNYTTNGQNLVADLKLNAENSVETPIGTQLSIDMGSRHSFLSENTLDYLQQVGYPVKVTPTFVFTTDPSGRFRFYTRKVNMPVRLPNPLMPDSAITLQDCELLLTPNTNILGMDFLRSFAIEYIHDTHTMRLYLKAPEGYDKVSDIKTQESFLDDVMGTSRRVYIPLTVNDTKPQNYYFDTGAPMAAYELVQPAANVEHATSQLYTDPERGFSIQPDCRVMIGNRMHFGRVAYVDTLHTDKYSINPMTLFSEDFIMDLPNGELRFAKCHHTTHDKQ